MLLLPGPARSDWLGFRNDLKTAVIVQGINVGNPAASNLHRLFPGEACMEVILRPGNRLVLVYDARTKLLLYQGQIECRGNRMYSLRLDPTGNVTLVRTTFPVRPQKPAR
jgi:hypothetical protein